MVLDDAAEIASVGEVSCVVLDDASDITSVGVVACVVLDGASDISSVCVISWEVLDGASVSVMFGSVAVGESVGRVTPIRLHCPIPYHAVCEAG